MAIPLKCVAVLFRSSPEGKYNTVNYQSLQRDVRQVGGRVVRGKHGGEGLRSGVTLPIELDTFCEKHGLDIEPTDNLGLSKTGVRSPVSKESLRRR